MTTEEVAERLGVSPARVRQFVGEERLPAERGGRTLLFERSAVDKFAAQDRRAGRPGVQARGSTSRPEEEEVAVDSESPAPAAPDLEVEVRRLREENLRLRRELGQARQLAEALQGSVTSLGQLADVLANSLSE